MLSKLIEVIENVDSKNNILFFDEVECVLENEYIPRHLLYKDSYANNFYTRVFVKYIDIYNFLNSLTISDMENFFNNGKKKRLFKRKIMPAISAYANLDDKKKKHICHIIERSI